MGEKYSPELAKQVLDRNPDIPENWRAFWEAIINGTLPEYYLAVCKSKRNDYSDDLPNQDVRLIVDQQVWKELQEGIPHPRMTRYKCQTNFLVSLGLNLRSMLDQEIVTDPDIMIEIDKLFAGPPHFTIGDPENAARISQINELLDHVIGHLEQQINPQLDNDTNNMVL